MDRTGYLGAIQKDPYKVEPSLIPYHPGSNSPGGLLFFERLLPSGIVFFKRLWAMWPGFFQALAYFFLTFARRHILWHFHINFRDLRFTFGQICDMIFKNQGGMIL